MDTWLVDQLTAGIFVTSIGTVGVAIAEQFLFYTVSITTGKFAGFTDGLISGQQRSCETRSCNIGLAIEWLRYMTVGYWTYSQVEHNSWHWTSSHMSACLCRRQALKDSAERAVLAQSIEPHHDNHLHGIVCQEDSIYDSRFKSRSCALPSAVRRKYSDGGRPLHMFSCSSWSSLFTNVVPLTTIKRK